MFETLIKQVDDEVYSPNWGMAMMWASLANAIPVSFKRNTNFKNTLKHHNICNIYNQSEFLNCRVSIVLQIHYYNF